MNTDQLNAIKARMEKAKHVFPDKVTDFRTQALDDIQLLVEEVERLAFKLARYEYDENADDAPRKFCEEIADAHPISHDFPIVHNADELYALALELVGERKEKYSLVDLVNWLLVEQEKLRSSLRVKDEALRMAGQSVEDILFDCIKYQQLAIDKKTEERIYKLGADIASALSDAGKEAGRE